MGPELVELERRHNRFIWPVTAFFLTYHFSLNVLAGVAPEFMGRKVFGEFTFGYLYALSQFLMAFIIAWADTRYARRRLDPLLDKPDAPRPGHPPGPRGACAE